MAFTLHELVSKFKLLAKELGRTPTRQEFMASGISDWQLKSINYTKILKGSGLESEKNKHFSPEKPKIFLFDIETSPIVAHVWGLYDQNVGINQIVKDWHLLSWAGKWYGEKEIFYFDQRNSKDLADDKEILEELKKKLDEADIVIGHNLIKFDVKKVNARFLFHKLKPPVPSRAIDTLRIARKYFAVTSNKLEFLAEFLKCKNKKSKHKKFNGHELWMECLKGNQAAFKEMESYNRMDVIVLEDVYNSLKAWDKTINFSIFEKDNLCSCGHRHFISRGHMTTNTGVFKRFSCKKCGKWYSQKTNLLDKTLRSELLK